MALFHHAKPSHAMVIRPVYEHNLEKEFAIIRKVAASYRCVAIDTEFPGLVYRTASHPRFLSPEQRYALVKANVDSLKLIQLGLTLSNMDSGDAITWEFNFRGFNPEIDAQDPESVEFLESNGIDFSKNYTQGVDVERFAELFWSSGLLTKFNRTWITFHGTYDLAFLIKMLSHDGLPDTMQKFLYRVTCYFGFDVFDVKHLSKSCNGLYGSLENVAKILGINRIAGQAHQAGSDSLLISDVYKKMQKIFFKNGIEWRHTSILCGIQEL
ncbi:CCR4-NOT transcription complex subunit 7 [Rhynchospora pubera]|uniref:poly(A)-specific ribonuclease n=1 Tax=Rhynchospora pubera TaxID=906938 RepID=A0AAV8EDR0_9POAL|nr:CCR4-NOT transcription complex subunit 7 [Rhynchospora pubera]